MNAPGIQIQDDEQLQELMDEIIDLTVGETWSIPIQQVCDILEVSKEEYFRSLYADRMSGAFMPEMLDGFEPGNVDMLVSFLEKCGHPAAPHLFFQQGYYFSGERLLDAMELFISVSLSRLVSHEVDRELLDTALAGCLHFEDAAQFYILEKIDADEFVSFATDVFLKRYNVESHYLSRSILIRYLKEQIKQRIIRLEDLHQVLESRLHERAVLWGLIDPHVEEEITGIHLSGRLLDALATLDFKGDMLPTRTKLKDRYRSLMKTYHPDINPEGLEKTRQINEAYFLVMAEFTE